MKLVICRQLLLTYLHNIKIIVMCKDLINVSAIEFLSQVHNINIAFWYTGKEMYDDLNFIC